MDGETVAEEERRAIFFWNRFEVSRYFHNFVALNNDFEHLL